MVYVCKLINTESGESAFSNIGLVLWFVILKRHLLGGHKDAF